MHPQQPPMSDTQQFGQGLVEYIHQTAGSSRLHAVLLDVMSYSNWNNAQFNKLINSTIEFYHYLVTAERGDPGHAFNRAIQICCTAAMAVAVSRSQLAQQMNHQEAAMYNDAMLVLRQADETMNSATAQPPQQSYQQPGRNSLYARSNVAPSQSGYQHQHPHQPTSAPSVNRRPTIGNFTPGYNAPVTNTADVQRNALYRNQPKVAAITPTTAQPVSNEQNANPRYNRAKDAIPPAVSIQVDDVEFKEAQPLSEIAKMKYETHRLAPVTTPKITDRNNRNLEEFLGVLANPERYDVVALGAPVDTPLDQQIVGLPDTFAAVGLDMAILRAKGMLRDAIRQARNPIVEFEYTNIRGIHFATEAEISAAIVECPQIGLIAAAADYFEAHAVMADYLVNRPKSTELYSISDRIMAEINNRLTEAVNRNLAFVMFVGERIDDFAADWPDLLKLLDKNYDDYQGDLRTNVKQVIERCTMVGILDVSSTDFVDLNKFMDDALADSVCVMDLTSVTLLPLMSTELDLAVSDSMSLVSVEKLPKLHAALEGVIERLEFSYMFYTRIYLVTEDGVLIEIIPTMIPTGRPAGECRTKYAIRLVDRS